MAGHRKDGLATRRRLLEAACEAFAARGFRNTSVAGICAGAGANIASVNYHFKSKKALYVESWRYSLTRSLQAHPPDGGVPADAPPWKRLEGRIASIMERVVDRKGHDFDIIHKEMANPSGLLDGAIRDAIEPLRADFMKLIRELVGRRASERTVHFCHMSIMAQCLGPLLRERHAARSSHPRRPPECERFKGNVEELAKHVAKFSLAGIYAVSGRRTEQESRRRPSRGIRSSRRR